ncbi:MAG: carbamoyltransferase C-terminal domain-containing protein [Candidatus Asgardarchaeia archaeon]
MTLVIGVSDGHDAGATLIDDNGNILFAASEERFTRVKHQRGFPYNSLKHIYEYLTSHNLIDDLEIIAVGGIFRREKRCISLEKGISKLFPKIPIIYIDHHLSHAASAYYTSGFDKSLIITLDAAGDGLSGTVSLGNNGTIVPLHTLSYINSIGDFFAAITELLGYKPMSDEHKVASMAAYGDSTKYGSLMKEIIDFDKSSISFLNKIGVIGHRATIKIKEKLNKNYNPFDIAASAQNHLLKLVSHFFETAVGLYRVNNICFAGGIAGNVQLNMILKKATFTNDLWIFPHMGDGGLCVGAALEALARHKLARGQRLTPKRLTHVYLGPSIYNKQLKEKLRKYKNTLTIHEKAREDTIPQLIEKNFFVGLVQGNMEYGPRALGNRSLLANPTIEKNKYILNKRKGRPLFQPFAPTILYEHSANYLKDPFESKFMTFAFKVTESAIIEIPAIVHRDNTTRPQTIRDENEIYRKIIRNIYDQIGVPVVLNTSLNLHGEPIVFSLEDAIYSLKKGLIDVLFINDYMIAKKGVLN